MHNSGQNILEDEEFNDNYIPDNLEEAQAELIRHREFVKKKEKMIKENQEAAEMRLKYAPSYIYVIETLTKLVDGNDNPVDFPKDGIVGLYFGMRNCPACHRFDAVLTDFISSNAERGFRVIYIPVDNTDHSNFSGINARYIWRISKEDPDAGALIRKKLRITMFPTMIIVDPVNHRVVTRYGREAVDVEKLAGSALSAWKNNLSGFFPSFFERRRTMYFSPVGFLIWTIAIFIILHFYFGFSITQFVLDSIKWFFYTFVDPSNNPGVSSPLASVKKVVSASRLRG